LSPCNAVILAFNHVLTFLV